MSDRLPLVYLARHEETARTITEQHPGPTDLFLTEYGERRALRLGEGLKELVFAKVFTSPLQRARRTCELAGFGSVAEIDSDLVEWNYSACNYGQFEGHHGADIRFERPYSNQFRDGCLEGETPEQGSARPDNVVSRVRAISGDVLLFTRGYFIRVLAVRWLGLEPAANSRYLMLRRRA
jgi:broad specificity phosphatase PhoE